jgi:hypothetical protein
LVNPNHHTGIRTFADDRTQFIWQPSAESTNCPPRPAQFKAGIPRDIPLAVGDAPLLAYTQSMVSMPLDSNLKQALASGSPVEVFDPATHEIYYLLTADQFQNLQAARGDFDPQAAYPLVEQIMAEDDASDPLLDSYQ